MTAITGKVRITKRPGELGVHSMDAFNMAVPDLKIAEDFYKTFGLDVREEGEGLGLYTFGSAQRWASIGEGARKKLNFLSFAAFEEDFEPMKRRIEAEGIRLMDAPRGFDTNGICFMHGIHGSDHHLVAFAKSGAPGLHHCSWDVGSINEIGKGAMQMVRDPWGSHSEYSADIDYIPATCDWQAGDYPPEDSIYLWGPEIPADFVVNHEAAA